MPEATPEPADSWKRYRDDLAVYREACGAPTYREIDDLSVLIADQKRNTAGTGPVPLDKQLPRSTANKLPSGDARIKEWLQVQAFLHACHVHNALRGRGDDTVRTAKADVQAGTRLPWMPDDDLQEWKRRFDALTGGIEVGSVTLSLLPDSVTTPAPAEELRRRRPVPRRVWAALAALVLVAAIAGAGFKLLTDSKNGTPSASGASATPTPSDSATATPSRPSGPASTLKGPDGNTAQGGTSNGSGTTGQNGGSRPPTAGGGGGAAAGGNAGGGGPTIAGTGPSRGNTGTGASGSNISTSSPKPAKPKFEVMGTCNTAGQKLTNTSSGFTPGGTYKDVVLAPDGSVYPLPHDTATVNSDGTVNWSWLCESKDDNGTYTAQVTDEASGITVTDTFVVNSHDT